VTYVEVMETTVKAIEVTGVAILIIGGLVASAAALLRMARHQPGAYDLLRKLLGRVILLGLEVLILGDIVRTVAVEATFQAVAVLALLVIVRIVLSFAIEVEIGGAWPWRRSAAAEHPARGPSDEPPVGPAVEEAGQSSVNR
jgi:uncharacterized membrane protein